MSRHAAGQGGAAGRLSSREPRNRCISEAAKSQSWARRRLPRALTAPAHGRRPQQGSAVASCPHPCALGEVPDQATPPRRAQASPPPVQCSQRPPGTSSPSRSRRESCGWEGAASRLWAAWRGEAALPALGWGPPEPYLPEAGEHLGTCGLRADLEATGSFLQCRTSHSHL